MLVKRLKPLPVEAVVRGYLAGSGWKEYQAARRGLRRQLPPGLKNASKLPEPIFTPATKAEMGDHDENIDFERMARDRRRRAGARRCATSRSGSTSEAAADRARPRASSSPTPSSSSAWTTRGTLTLMDEVLTPDSSRFWPVEELRSEGAQPAELRQAVRARLAGGGAHRRPALEQARAGAGAAAEVIEKTAAKYREALARLTTSEQHCVAIRAGCSHGSRAC